jgi:hypothetical protein
MPQDYTRTHDVSYTRVSDQSVDIRRFLEKEYGLAAIEIHFSATKEPQWCNCTVRVCDSNNSAYLDFEYHSIKEQKDSLEKLDILISSFEELREAIKRDTLLQKQEDERNSKSK